MRVQPITPAAAPTNVAQAAEGVGHAVEELGGVLERHLVARERIQAQQEGYEAAAAYNQTLQKVVAQEKGNVGMKAKGGVQRLAMAISGVPGAPGQRGVAPLREQFLPKGRLARAAFERSALSHETVANGQIINHEMTQVNKAMEDSSTRSIDRLIDSGVSIHFPDELATSQRQLAEHIDGDLWLRSKYSAEQIATMKEGFLDKQAETAIKARAHENYKLAQQMLDSADTITPKMRSHLQQDVIDPAQVKQYIDTGTAYAMRDQDLRDKQTGEIDTGKAYKVVSGMVEREKLPAGHKETAIREIIANLTAENSRLNETERIKKDSAILAINKLAKDPSATLSDARDKIVGRANFLRGQTFTEVDEFAKRAFSKDPSAGDVAWSAVPQPVKDALTFQGPEIDKKFPYAEDRRAFTVLAKQRLLDSGVRTQDEATELLKKMVENTPSGEARFLGFGKAMKPQYEIDEELAKDMKTVRQLGGFDKAREIAQAIGGTEKLAKAVEVLRSNKYPITEQAINALRVSKPDLLK